MIRVTASVDERGARAILVDIGDRVTNRRDLNEALALRYVEELQAHWRKKNRKKNKLGGRRTNFWAKAAEETGVVSVTDDGATVAVGGESGPKVRIHVLGGTIVPKVAKALTIPLVREAYDRRAAEYEEETGKNLFTIPGRAVLFEKRQRGGTESLIAATQGRTNQYAPGNTIPLAARQQLRPVYLLAKQATIERDPDALPDEAKMLAALLEEAEDWLDEPRKGGPA